MTACDRAEEISAALLAKQRHAPHNADVDDDTLTGIVQTVVADTCLILDGTLAPEEFIP